MLMAVVAAGSLVMGTRAAQGEAYMVSTTSQPTNGATEIIRLSQAKLSDDTIIHYIKSSGQIYPLNASQIIYLKEQGVSEAVINAMLEQQTSGDATTRATFEPMPAVRFVGATGSGSTPSGPRDGYARQNADLTNDDTAVYGTGYDYQPGMGSVYYASPITWSWGYGSPGWTWGFYSPFPWWSGSGFGFGFTFNHGSHYGFNHSFNHGFANTSIDTFHAGNVLVGASRVGVNSGSGFVVRSSGFSGGFSGARAGIVFRSNPNMGVFARSFGVSSAGVFRSSFGPRSVGVFHSSFGPFGTRSGVFFRTFPGSGNRVFPGNPGFRGGGFGGFHGGFSGGGGFGGGHR